MKTLQESILSSVKAGKSSITDYIKNTDYMLASFYNDFSKITFKDFLDCVDEQTMTKCLKSCFKKASKDNLIGRVTFCFKDGNLGIEIKSNGGYLSYDKILWREAFVKSADLKDDNNKYTKDRHHVTPANFTKAFYKSAENGACEFSTEKGASLKEAAKEYIEYLKKNYKALYY